MKKIFVILFTFFVLGNLKAQEVYETSCNNNLSFNKAKPDESDFFDKFFSIANDDLTVCYDNFSKKISVSLNSKTNYYIEIFDKNNKIIFSNYFHKQCYMSTSDYKHGNYTIYIFSKQHIITKKFSI